MIFAEIIYLGKNKEGQDKMHFEVYNAPPKLIDDYLKIKEERRKYHEEDFDQEEKHYIVSRGFVLCFLGKNNFIPITKDFFYREDLKAVSN